MKFYFFTVHELSKKKWGGGQNPRYPQLLEHRFFKQTWNIDKETNSIAYGDQTDQIICRNKEIEFL